MFKKNVQFQRKSILLGKELEQQNEQVLKSGALATKSRRKVVALTGTHNGAGCTHIALMLAYKLSQSYEVALVELDKKNDLKGFNDIYDLKLGDLGSKKLGKLDLYFFDQNSLIDILKKGYDYIFLDIGKGVYVDDLGKIKSYDLLNEAYRADVKLLITQTKEWQCRYLADFIKYDGNMKDWIIIANMANKKEMKELEVSVKGIRSEIKRLPYLEEVFNVDAKEVDELISIIDI